MTEPWEFLPGGAERFVERWGEVSARLAERMEAARQGIPATLAAIRAFAEAS